MPHGALASPAAEAAAPGSSPPGSNDHDCEPTAERPDPVVLVHGLGANRTVNWQTMSPLLANEGYCVFALTYGTALAGEQVGGLRPMEQSTGELAAFVDGVLAATGAERVDLVGHSEGTLMPQYWLQFLGGNEVVDDYVAVTPLYDGTLADPLPVDALVDALGVRDAAGAPVAPACGSCEIDFSDHLTIIFSERTGQVILNALDPQDAQGLPCRPVAPLLGNELLR